MEGIDDRAEPPRLRERGGRNVCVLRVDEGERRRCRRPFHRERDRLNGIADGQKINFELESGRDGRTSAGSITLVR